MPTITAYADLFRDWEGVSGACAQNAPLLPKSEAIRPELDAILVQVKDLKIQQENLKGNAQAMTQRLWSWWRPAGKWCASSATRSRSSSAPRTSTWSSSESP